MKYVHGFKDAVRNTDTRKANENSLMTNGAMMMGIESVFGGNCILRLLITNAFSAHSFGEDDYGYFPRGCGSMYGGHDPGSGYGGSGFFSAVEVEEAEQAAKRRADTRRVAPYRKPERYEF